MLSDFHITPPEFQERRRARAEHNPTVWRASTANSPRFGNAVRWERLTSKVRVGWIGGWTGPRYGMGTPRLEPDRRGRLRCGRIVGRITGVYPPLSLNGCFAQLWCRGPEPMGIITWKHELVVVPFSGPWAACGGSVVRPHPHAARLAEATISITIEYNVVVSRAGIVRLGWGTSVTLLYPAVSRYPESCGR